MTLGSMFGIKGAIIGAVAGFTFGLGKAAIEYISDEVLDKGTLTNKMEELVNERTETDSRLAELVQRRQELLDGGFDTSRIEKEISDLKTQIADESQQAEQTYLEEKARLEEKLEKERILASNRMANAKRQFSKNPEAQEKNMLRVAKLNKEKEQEILDQIKANEAAALKLGADYDVINPNSSLKGQGPLMDMGKTQEQINMEKAPTMSQFLDRMGGSTDQSVTIVKNSPVYNQVFNQGGSSSATNNSYVLAGSQGGGSDGLPI